MAELLADLGTYLNAQGVGDLGATSPTLAHIHLVMLRDTPDRAIALIQLPGMGPVETMNDGLPTLVRPRLQVFTRWDDEDYEGSLTLARSVYNTLGAISNDTINSVLYQRIEPVDEPAVFDRDDEDRVVFVCNYQVWRPRP